MAKLSNLLVMIELLKNGRKYSIKELSEYLEVSERTVREYKLFLDEAGIYVETIRGPYGGYVLRKDVNLPALHYSSRDIDLLKELVTNIHDEQLKEKMSILTDKLSMSILAEDTKSKKLVTDDQELQVYNNLSKALKNHYKVRIKYYNLQHGESLRTIYPLGLYLFQNEWWCSSYWEEKDDMRQFHLKRIREVEVLNEHFDPKEINLKF